MTEPAKTTAVGPGESSSDALSWSGEFPRLSVIALVVSNLIPLFGVLFAGWRVFPIMLLFSLENIIIGFYNVLRMCMAPCDLEELARTSKDIHTKRGLIIFFCIHYGGFVFIHLIFVIMLFGVAWASGFKPFAVTPTSVSPQAVTAPVEPLVTCWWALGAALIACFISHGISFVKNFIGSGEYKRVTANKLMLRPYGRMIVMHVTIVLGAFLVLFTGTHVVAVALLVVLKLILDLAGHLRERKKFRKNPRGQIETADMFFHPDC
ncbi:MAG: DUF6498-containing protein [Planctomycetota bacterium]|nr:DUF6498-containing protein [Planctomycetota bacterium]